MDKKQLIILIVTGIILFLVGGALGMTFIQKTPEQTKVQTANNMSSKVISSIATYGQVKSIDGKNITLSNLGDDLAISIADNASIFSFTFSTTDKTKPPVQKTATIGDIKVGDKVNIAVKLLSTGQLQGISVMILPSAVQNN